MKFNIEMIGMAILAASGLALLWFACIGMAGERHFPMPIRIMMPCIALGVTLAIIGSFISY